MRNLDSHFPTAVMYRSLLFAQTKHLGIQDAHATSLVDLALGNPREESRLNNARHLGDVARAQLLEVPGLCAVDHGSLAGRVLLVEVQGLVGDQTPVLRVFEKNGGGAAHRHNRELQGACGAYRDDRDHTRRDLCDIHQ